MGAIGELGDVDLAAVEATVGPRSFARGQGYARGNRVLSSRWDQDLATLTGSVVGRGALYDVVAYFEAGTGGLLSLDDGECTCPVGYNCKHVAALVIAAADGPGARPTRDERRPQPHGPAVEMPSWDEPLRALIRSPAQQAASVPLVIELALQADDRAGAGPMRLLATLKRRGARDGWVKASLTWGGLDSWQARNGEYDPQQLALLRELHAIQRVSDARPAYRYSYGYGTEKTLELDACDSTQLWSLLKEAERTGLRLVHREAGLGDVRVDHGGELVIDVTQDPDHGSLVRAVLHVDGIAAEHLQPLLFIGARGHGVVCAQAGAVSPGRESTDGRLRLVRLARPAPVLLQRMLLGRERLTVPAGEMQRFADELCPALRNVAAVVSSDGSFEVPEISEPGLVLRASYGPGHVLDLEWQWAYTVGAVERRAALGDSQDSPGFRDPAAERATLAALDLAGTGLEHIGLLDHGGRPAAVHPIRLTGMDSARLSSEILPGLAGRADIGLELVGEPADYRDVGDSLMIGLSTAELAGDRDWFELGVTITVEGREVPFAEVFVALAEGQEQMLLEDGAHFSLLEPSLQSLRRLIEEARGLSDSPAAQLRISRYQAGLWAELVALGVVTEQAAAWRRQVAGLLEIATLADHEPPAALNGDLRPYQREGFGWLASMWELELGGILADDMGLGKTLQALALICHVNERNPDSGPFLVVAPTSVVSNWVSEAARFAPGLAVAAVSDTLAKSGRAIEQVAEADMVVTTYTLLRLEAEAYRTVQWAGLILDEAQYVKNHQAKTYRCVRELSVPFKLAITGTPMENNLTELWSLLSVTSPGLFPDPKRFAEQYARPIERAGDSEQLARLRHRIRPLVKRRTKELVAADLPAKQEQTLAVELHRRHRKLYDTHLQRERQKILGMLDDFDRNRFTILRSITLLRQLSLHPGLVEDDHAKVPCAKLDALVEQLGDIAGSGHRALVFSQFTGFLATARQRLDAEGIGYCYLDGRTRRRDRVLQAFKEGTDPVFLISLKAGGFGLNLTEADYCFLLDPWWNPATEAQAIDRTHRIGQTRPVNVYRLISRGTIEEKVVALAQRKAELFSGVLDDGDLFAAGITADDIRGLLG